MSKYLNEFEFERLPKKITYSDKDPLILSNELTFYHNKNKFRKELTRLQNLFKTYTKTPLLATAIRDTFLKEEYTEELLIVMFSTSENLKEINQIIEAQSELKLNQGCFYLGATSKYMLLLARDMEGLKLGVDSMESILNQILENFMNQKIFDDYIMIRPFEIYDCKE